MCTKTLGGSKRPLSSLTTVFQTDEGIHNHERRRHQSVHARGVVGVESERLRFVHMTR